ncbi:hypothetical protein [Nocardia rhizosphaerae]|uniref:PPE family protein n=1 Tax=Nocardia rhizosphaerae TaxID=1691571 RepID=A0ABV8L2E6_9NOCA
MGETPNPWSGLRTESLNGALELQPGVIESLVTEIIEVRTRVNSVKAEVGKVDSLDPFAAVIPSAAALAERFSAKGRDLAGILEDHLQILDDMSDTFLAAGRNYSAADADGSVDLEALRERIQSGKGNTESLGSSGEPFVLCIDSRILSEEGGGLPDSLLMPPGELTFDPLLVRPEDPSQFTYDQYQEIIASLSSPNMSTTVAQAGVDWSWLAGKLDEKFVELSNAMTATESSWRSPGNAGGADRARRAVAAYGTGNTNLVEGMKALGTALQYAAEWLYVTKLGLQAVSATEVPLMVPESVRAWETRKELEHQRGYVSAMRNTYVPGVDHTGGVIAVLPDPIPATTGNGYGDGSGNGNGSGNGSGTGSGSGSGSGSGATGLSSGFQNGMSALQQQAAQRAAQDALKAAEQAAADQATRAAEEAARQAAEEAAQQAAGGLEQAGSALSSGMEQASSAAQSALDQATSAAEQSALSSVPGLAGLSSALEDQAKKMTSAAKSGGGAGGGAGGGGAGVPGSNLQNASSLFPRAAVTSTGMEAMASRAGLAGGSGMPMGGMPMAPMGGAAGQGGQQKEHKRADYLDSVEHLEEAIGAAPIVARPVIEQ